MTVLCPDPNKDAKFWKDLYGKVISRLPANIRMQLTVRSSLNRTYKIRIEILGFEGSPNCVARVQSSLTWDVFLDTSLKRSAIADVWTTAPMMKVVSIQNLPETVSKMVMDQLEEFISDYQKAKSKHPQVRPSDANDTAEVSAPALKESSQQPAKKAVAGYKYVASKNSQVFHTPTCRSAKRISPENMIGYSTREEAINAGKRPCKLCTP